MTVIATVIESAETATGSVIEIETEIVTVIGATGIGTVTESVTTAGTPDGAAGVEAVTRTENVTATGRGTGSAIATGTTAETETGTGTAGPVAMLVPRVGPAVIVTETGRGRGTGPETEIGTGSVIETGIAIATETGIGSGVIAVAAGDVAEAVLNGFYPVHSLCHRARRFAGSRNTRGRVSPCGVDGLDISAVSTRGPERGCV